MKINYVSLCSGYGAECIAFKRLKRDYPDFDFECLAWSEIEPNAIKAHDAIHQEYIGRNLGDLTKVDWEGWHKSIGNPHIDLLFASTPCQSVSSAVADNAHRYAKGCVLSQRRKQAVRRPADAIDEVAGTHDTAACRQTPKNPSQWEKLNDMPTGARTPSTMSRQKSLSTAR